MKSVIGILLYSVFITSQQGGPKIEIYLLKSRLPAIDNENWPSFAVKHFTATKNDLQDSAFILDTEILSYDSTRCNIGITKSAALKISSLKPGIPQGIQFVLTIDKEPVLQGFFINKNASEPVMSYMIMNKNDTICHIDRLLPGIKADERKSKNLINAFKVTRRLQ